MNLHDAIVTKWIESTKKEEDATIEIINNVAKPRAQWMMLRKMLVKLKQSH